LVELLQNAVTSGNDALNFINAQFIKIRLKQLKFWRNNTDTECGVPPIGEVGKNAHCGDKSQLQEVRLTPPKPFNRNQLGAG
jgi:hypothetical protein